MVKTKERGQFQMGVDSTPTFFIKGKKYRGALKPEQVLGVLDSML
ncbi:MAG: thioredoxin domain-containing protein [Rhizobiaceae bacterium]|nr:thioredoxin domain-containing protein [Rhizobiaceae bacterium]